MKQLDKSRTPKQRVLKKYPKARLADDQMLIENGHWGRPLSGLCNSPKQAWEQAARRVDE